MNRRELLKKSGIVAAAACNAGDAFGIGSPAGPMSPNIVWIISDDHTRDDLGCYGNPVRTPNLDALAARGMRFMNSFVTSPSCSPSRSSFFTGMYAHTLRTEDLHIPLGPDWKILPSLLREKGYFSGNLLKLHLGPEGEKQFDRVYKKISDWPSFVNDWPRENPFFLAFGFTEPHRPYQENIIPDPHRPLDVNVPPFLPDLPEVRKDLAQYYDEIALLDSEVGKFLNWLEHEGLMENTLIVFWGDNGMPFPRAKTTLYDAGIRVPMIAFWKGRIPGGSVQNGLFSFIDIAPTMLEAAGVEPPENMQGRSMLRMFLNPDEQGRDVIFSERNWHDIDDHMRCLRTERFKYIRNSFPGEPYGIAMDIANSPTYQAMIRELDAGKLPKEQMLLFRSVRPEEELYDLRYDPNEFHNLVYRTEYRHELERLSGLLDAWIAETDDVPPEKRFYNIHNVRTGAAIRETRPVPRKNP